ncbi:MAG TPA: cupredoxin domain-containing protein [Mycobacteriales bacterium]|jgi:plastocyanin|nr:cupredoxin domain-containing protein [Mycobacteriales bacterium]
MRHAVLAAALVAATATIPSHAADAAITAAGNAFLPGSVSVSRGSHLTFANADVAPHNVVADASGRTGPLFASKTVTAGQTAEVTGVAKLKPGTYPFHCSVHPRMVGALTITGGNAATVAATPAGSVPTPTSLAFFGNALYVASYTTNQVLTLPVLPGGVLGQPAPYVTGLDEPLGVAFAPDGTLFVSDSHAAGAARAGRVWQVDSTGTKKVVIDGLPNGRHNTNGLAVRNNRLYVANGSSTDDGVTGGPPERPLSGTVLSYALPIRPGAKPVVEARGLRNAFDLAFAPGTGDLWFATNGPDALDPYGEDLLHKVPVARGTYDYGFPGCVYAADLERAQNRNVAIPCAADVRRPERALGLHVSADGLAFGTGGAWGSDLYVAEYGSNAPPRAGHTVVRIPVANGRAGEPETLLTGAAPIDVAFGPDGLYVADFDTGAILLLRAVG